MRYSIVCLNLSVTLQCNVMCLSVCPDQKGGRDSWEMCAVFNKINKMSTQNVKKVCIFSQLLSWLKRKIQLITHWIQVSLCYQTKTSFNCLVGSAEHTDRNKTKLTTAILVKSFHCFNNHQLWFDLSISLINRIGCEKKSGSACCFHLISLVLWLSGCALRCWACGWAAPVNKVPAII